jgi:polyhydroxyalkanoate synthesis regulator phasin
MPRARSSPRRARNSPARSQREGKQARVDEGAGGLAGAAEEVVNRLLARFDAVLLSRERIQATLDEAAERGRVTRSDANELVFELLQLGRQQTEDFIGELQAVLGRGREQLESSTRRARRSEPVDRLLRSADRARRVVGVGLAFPISGYDELTVAQVCERLGELTPSELRQVLDHERRHANRKSVLAKIERLLD